MRNAAARDMGFVEQDGNFVALVDGHFADAAQRSGPHLLCRPGCSQCCVGAFAIGPADALRIQRGLQQLEQEDPHRASRLRSRAAASWSRLVSGFPGNAVTGELAVDEDSELLERFLDFADDEPCPALDPEQGTCDLYQARPHTCRVFGPPVATPEGYGICELCFQKAGPQEIAAAVITPEAPGAAQALDQAALAAGATPGSTVLAFTLSRPR